MNNDRRSFLKMLGLGTAGLAVSQIESAFTPDVEKDIEALKQKLVKQLNVKVEVNFNKDNINKIPIIHKEFLDLDINDHEKIFYAIQNFISPYFDKPRKTKKFPDSELVKTTIDHLKHYQSKVIQNGFYRFYINEYLGACYLLMEDYDLAQEYFQNIISTHDKKDSKLIDYRLNSVIYYYESRNIPFPTNFQFK